MIVIIVSPNRVLQIIQASIQKGIKAGVVITAGFAEMSNDGYQMQLEMKQLARKGGMVLVGPNCNGIMSPFSQLYCTMAPNYPQRGSLAVLSQSGNVGSTVVSNLMFRGLGISCYVSTGNEADLHFPVIPFSTLEKAQT